MPSGLELYKPDGTLAFSTPRGDRPCYLLYAIPFVRSEFLARKHTAGSYFWYTYHKTFAGLDPARMVTLNDAIIISGKDELTLRYAYSDQNLYKTIYIMGW